jgi:hypothetical protein
MHGTCIEIMSEQCLITNIYIVKHVGNKYCLSYIVARKMCNIKNNQITILIKHRSEVLVIMNVKRMMDGELLFSTSFYEEFQHLL